MDEITNALKVPFTTIPPDRQPRPLVVAAVWGVIGVLFARAL